MIRVKIIRNSGLLLLLLTCNFVPVLSIDITIKRTIFREQSSQRQFPNISKDMTIKALKKEYARTIQSNVPQDDIVSIMTFKNNANVPLDDSATIGTVDLGANNEIPVTFDLFPKTNNPDESFYIFVIDEYTWFDWLLKVTPKMTVDQVKKDLRSIPSFQQHERQYAGKYDMELGVIRGRFSPIGFSSSGDNEVIGRLNENLFSDLPLDVSNARLYTPRLRSRWSKPETVVMLAVVAMLAAIAVKKRATLKEYKELATSKVRGWYEQSRLKKWFEKVKSKESAEKSESAEKPESTVTEAEESVEHISTSPQ